MLTQANNELLTQAGPGTPMGAYFRSFWLPALMPSELPEADCPPVRLKLLGENLVAFRDTSGRVAFMAESCPHRGASMFFGRNEEDGLRCVYHGWKFDVTGACVDMPNEPAESNFKHKIRATIYPGAEWGDVIWVYMGPTITAHGEPVEPPELPNMEWCVVPSSHRFVKRWVHEANWAQGVEGDIDTSHAPFLHGVLGKPSARGVVSDDLSPVLTVRETDYGFVYGGRLRARDGKHYWRLTQWMLPCFSIIASDSYPKLGHCYIPIDDEHTNVFGYYYNGDRPLTEEEYNYPASGRGVVPPTRPGELRPIPNKDNDYLIDREMQRKVNFTGIVGIQAQDMAAVQSMGTIANRTREHLGTADMAIIAFRRLVMRLATEAAAGTPPYSATHPDVYKVTSWAATSENANMDGFLAEAQRDLMAHWGGAR